MRINKLINKLNFIVYNCGLNGDFFSNHPDILYNMGLVDLDIYDTDHGFVIKYAIEEENIVSERFINIYYNGKKEFYPPRKSIQDFKIAANVLNYIDTTLYNRARINYANDYKRVTSMINTDKYNGLKELYGYIIDDINTLKKYYDEYADENDKDNEFSNGEYKDEFIRVLFNSVRFNKYNSNEIPKRGMYQIYLSDGTLVFDLTFDKAVDLRTFEDGEWKEKLHAAAENYKNKISEIENNKGDISKKLRF